MIGDVKRHALRDLPDPGISGRAIEAVEQGALLELPGERMFAPAAPDQKHIHLDHAPLVRGRRDA